MKRYFCYEIRANGVQTFRGTVRGGLTQAKRIATRNQLLADSTLRIMLNDTVVATKSIDGVWS